MSTTKQTRSGDPLGHPMRQLIREGLRDNGPAEPAEIAEGLGESVSRIAYHVKVLLRAGLIEEIGTRQVRGCVAHLYAHAEPGDAVERGTRIDAAIKQVARRNDEGPMSGGEEATYRARRRVAVDLRVQERSSGRREAIVGVLRDWHAEAVGHREPLVSDRTAAERLLERAGLEPGTWQCEAIVTDPPEVELAGMVER